MGVPPFAVTFVCTSLSMFIHLSPVSLISAIVSGRYQCRGIFLLFCNWWSDHVLWYVEVISPHRPVFPGDASTQQVRPSMSATGPSSSPSVGAYCAGPALYTWIANSAPHVRRATAVLGIDHGRSAILATWLLGSISPAPKYATATITFIVMGICTVILLTAMVHLCQ